MRALRAVLVLLAVSALASCERGGEPIAPYVRPSLDGGVTLGGGGKADSTFDGTSSEPDTTTVSADDGGGTLGGGGK